MDDKTARNILIVLLALLGAGALGGGALLIISPSGEMIKMPLDMIKNSPFNSFLIPGFILFAVLGVFPIMLIFALLKKKDNKLAEHFNLLKDMHWAWTFTVYTGFAVIVWIQMEMVYINAVHWLHTFYVFYGLAIIAVALLPGVRNLYTKPIK